MTRLIIVAVALSTGCGVPQRPRSTPADEHARLSVVIRRADTKSLSHGRLLLIRLPSDTQHRVAVDTGYIRFDSLPAGVYRLVASSIGLQLVNTDIELRAACALSIEAQLEPYRCDIAPGCVDTPSRAVLLARFCTL